MSSSDENSVSDRRTLEQDQKIKSVLNDINCMTNNNFNSIEECVPFVKKLYKESQTKSRRQFSRDDYVTKDSSSGGDKQRQLLQEIEAFQDQIEELESKQRTSDKKYIKKLKDKEAEIEELNDKLVQAQNQNPKDNKIEEQKQKCTQFQNENEKLTKLMATKESQLKSQIAESEKVIETKQKAMDTMKNKITEFKLTEDKMKTNMKELEKERETVKHLNELYEINRNSVEEQKQKCTQLQNEKEMLTKLMETKESQFKSQIAESEKVIETKHKGLDTLKNKITDFKTTEDEMRIEMKELKKKLNTEKESVKHLNELYENSEKRNLEKVGKYKDIDVNRQGDEPPGWWKQHATFKKDNRLEAGNKKYNVYVQKPLLNLLDHY